MAARFYEARSASLGDRFLREFDQAVVEVRASPGLWPVIEGDLRCRTMNRFPFGIFHRPLPDEIRVMVVKHHDRRPDYARGRLGD